VSFRAPVAGTPWRILVNDPQSQLYGFLNGPGRWMGWLALAGLTVAGLAIILLIAGLARQRTRLTVLNSELGRLAAVDPLTGLRNRRAIEEFLHDALSAARRHDLPLSLLVIDVDHFKTFNDRLGHRSGDAVLAHTALVLEGGLRAEDAIGRWGGEEFLVVLTGTDEEGAVRATERLRAALAADQPQEAVAHGLSVTVTIGVAEWRQEDMNELISRADGAMYGGKAAGRDIAKVSTVMAAVADVPERA
jgi:diguanylate cyclase (GGDEF)-like protein